MNACKFERLEKILQESSIYYKAKHKLKFETYFKSGGSARVYIAPSSKNELIKTIHLIRKSKLPFKILGLTTNILLLDELDYGVIISTKNLTSLEVQEDTIDVECGYPLQDLVRVALINGLQGIEGLEGVPGTVGGALFMNAGAYGYTISDHLLSVEYIDSDGKVTTLTADKCLFNLRTSIFRNNPEYTIISAKLKLPKGCRKAIARKIETFHIARHSYQDFSYPNLGSMFSINGDFYRELFKGNKFYHATCYALKLILKNPASKFILRKRPNNNAFNALGRHYMGLDELRYLPSSKSMNILLNDGKCSFEDILDYISRIRSKLDKNISLENEIVLSPLAEECEHSKEIIKKASLKGFA